jgi:hypothetical protein
MGSDLSFSLKETQALLSTNHPENTQADIDKALAHSFSKLADDAQGMNALSSQTLGSNAAAAMCKADSDGEKAQQTPEDHVIDFVASNLGDLVEFLEQKLKAAGVEVVQSERMLITDCNGTVVDDWPSSDEGFPLRVRYRRATAAASTQEQVNLREHEQLVQDIYTSQGVNVVSLQARARNLLRSLGLRTLDVGARNVDERGNYIYNQCFYLSLSRGLQGHHAPRRQTQTLALQLKRSIEAAVIAERPHWTREVGEEAQAFADFLPIAMRKSSRRNLLSELAVCIIDSSSGHAEMYLGPMYKQLSDPRTQQRNFVLLWYTPGHYQCVVNDDQQGSKVMMAYKHFTDVLVSQGVQFIETIE